MHRELERQMKSKTEISKFYALQDVVELNPILELLKLAALQLE